MDFISGQILDGSIKPGEMLPSLNQLSIMLDISRETVKKAYNHLVRTGLATGQHGKGFFVAGRDGGTIKNVLVILDKQSVYNQILLQSMQDTLAGAARITILLHAQNTDVMEYYLDRNLDLYDFYVVSPHFPLDKASQERAVKLISRIPNRKLIMVDNWLRDVPGNYGVVYQDFRHDCYNALSQAYDDIVTESHSLKVMVMPQSLYGNVILQGVKEFAREAGVSLSTYRSAPASLEKGDVVLLLNSQLDGGLVDLAGRIADASLEPGRDVHIIAYNEMPINELVLGGLTVMSTDFPEMGRKAAEMILSGRLEKRHNPFRLVRRRTF